MPNFFFGLSDKLNISPKFQPHRNHIVVFRSWSFFALLPLGVARDEAILPSPSALERRKSCRWRPFLQTPQPLRKVFQSSLLQLSPRLSGWNRQRRSTLWGLPQHLPENQHARWPCSRKRQQYLACFINRPPVFTTRCAGTSTTICQPAAAEREASTDSPGCRRSRPYTTAPR